MKNKILLPCLLMISAVAFAQKDEVGEKIGKVSVELAAQRAKFAEVKNELDLARDREIRIKNILSADYEVGCRGVQKINKIEIKVVGDHLPIDQKINMGALGGPLGDQGSPKSFSISLGDSLFFQHTNEETTSAFVPSGGALQGIIPEGIKGRIRDIERLTLTKLGTGWKHDRRDWGCLFGCMVSENREQFMYRMDSISMTVNDAPFYFRSGVNFTFRGGSLMWSDQYFKGNDTYRKFMQTQCN